MRHRHPLERLSLLIATLTFAMPALTQVPQYGAGYGDDLLTLDQGWDNEARDRFYHEPQGSPIMPYAWFLVLEQADSTELFRANAHLSSFGLIPSASPSTRNPDALPIGLTKDLGIHQVESKLGMNCGACHVSEISYQGSNVLIDGGAAHFDFWVFMARLEEALRQTYEDDAKFARFAGKLLTSNADQETPAQLRARLRDVLDERTDWSVRNATHVRPGPGRVDALNVILNQVTAMMLDRADNARPSDAPVSYPFVWDAPYLDRVQYNAVVPNSGAGALGRNVGQVLGVFGEVSVIASTLPPGYVSSVRTDHLLVLESTMETLMSPTWRELAEKSVLPPIDTVKERRGMQIYDANCASCHPVINRRDRGELASIVVTRMPIADVGTDPVASLSFVSRDVATGPLLGRKTDFLKGFPFCERTHADQVLTHITVGAMMHDLGASGGPILDALGNRLYNGALDAMKSVFTHAPHGAGDQATVEQIKASMLAAGASEADITAALAAHANDKSVLFATLVEDGIDRHGENRHCFKALKEAVYRARPLNGVWATGPFLHNGSVPSLAALLLPPAERPARFYVGQREIDPVNVGFVDAEGPRTMLYDTSIPGNSNSGHTYGTALSAADKEALVEFMKIL